MYFDLLCLNYYILRIVKINLQPFLLLKPQKTMYYMVLLIPDFSLLNILLCFYNYFRFPILLVKENQHENSIKNYELKKQIKQNLKILIQI